MNPQTIKSLKVQNVMRVSLADITPEGHVVTITSKENGQGKSSIMDAVQMLFGGKTAIPEMPLTKGKSRGRVVGETEDLVITLDLSAAGPKLKVATKDGTPMKGPQGILDSLCGQLTFDPVSFDLMASKKPKEALELLRKLVGLDFMALDAKRAKVFADRTTFNRDLDSAKNKLTAYVHDPTAPAEEVSTAELVKKLEAAQTTNKGHQAKRQELDNAKDKIGDYNKSITAELQEITKIERQIAELQEKIVGLRSVISGFEMAKETHVKHVEAVTIEVAALVDVDEKAITDQMTNADTVNQKVRSNKRRAELVKEVADLTDKTNDLTDQLTAIDDDKTSQLQKAKFPLAEISFDETGPLLNGVPWAQGSTAERTRAAAAMGMALNPGLHVMLIRQGNDLSKSSLALLTEMAKEKGYQIWIERLESEDHGAIWIEDGKVVGAVEETSNQPQLVE